jgi:hypothetical protein
MTPEELKARLEQAREHHNKLEQDGPQTDDELHAWIIKEFGIDVPRVSVCPDHDAPFKFLSDLYFERVDSAILVANRGGSKTFLTALLHYLNGRFKAGCEMATIGAILEQAKIAYAHFKRFSRDSKGQQRPEVLSVKAEESHFRNGSWLKTLPGTLSSVNGPHPQKVHFDEVEIADPVVYQESRQMAAGKKLPDGRTIKAQDIITSTRKYAQGLVQQILDEIEENAKAGKHSTFTKYFWCIFETAAQVENCQCALPDLSEQERCPCDRVQQGKWDDGTPRTLKQVCQGRFYKSRGFKPLEDIINTFSQSSRAIWEAQQECSKPSTELLYIPAFDIEKHGIRNWQPNPDYGPIYQSVDFGGTNPHGVSWYQILRHEVDAVSYSGKPIRLKEGSVICFDEIYVSEIGNKKLAKWVVVKENEWRKIFPRFEVSLRFADPAAKAARLDWRAHRPPLKTVFYATREFEEHIKVIGDYFDDDLFRIDADRCQMWIEEAEAWRRKPETGKELEVFNHLMAAFRYFCANISSIERSSRRRTLPAASNDSANIKDYDSDPSIPLSAPKRGGIPDSERWRMRFGHLSGG